MAEKKAYIGGQAVIEGVMMRAPGCMSIAVRKPDGGIALQEGPLKTAFDNKFWKLPGMRGVVTLVESMKIGYRALQFSAEQQMNEEEKANAKQEGKFAALISIVIAIGLFIVLPQLLANGAGKLFGADFDLTSPVYHAIIGGFKFLIVLAYVIGISRIPEVRRVFQYHGAEHKTINAHEAGVELNVENVRAQTTLHPRCGTTFLVLVVFVSILLGIFAAPILLPNAKGFVGQLSLLALRLGLLPLIAAISFEFQRFTARFCTTGPLKVLLLPGFLFQKITTREPDDDQIEIAIAAYKAADWRTQIGDSLPSDEEAIHFDGFDAFLEKLPTLRQNVA